jgi:Xaa-Pro aminopeptidase
MAKKTFPKSEYEQRIKKAKYFMKRDGIDAIIGSHPKNFTYLTCGWRLGFDPVGYMIDEFPAAARPGMVIVPLVGEPVALVPRLFAGRSEGGWLENVKDWYGLPFKIEYLEKQLKDMGLSNGKIGMELGEEMQLFIPYVDFEKLKKDMSKIQFVPSNIFWELRLIKSRAEADKVKQTCNITGKGLAKFFTEYAKEDMRVKDVIRKLYECYMDAGATRPSFPPSLGLDLEAKTLKKGGVYSFDTAAVLDDYTADICRVAVVGRATQHHKDLYDKCLQLNDAIQIGRAHV